MTKIIKIFKSIVYAIKKRTFLNEEIVLFKLEKHIKQTSPIDITYVDKDNLNDLLDFQDKRYIDVFNSFLELGDIGYYAYFNEKCVHRSWVKSNEQVVSIHWSFKFKLKKDEIFIHYCETAPIARGKRIFPAVLSKIITDNRGKTILISVNSENTSSIKVVRKVGFALYKRVFIMYFLGVKLIRVSRYD